MVTIPRRLTVLYLLFHFEEGERKRYLKKYQTLEAFSMLLMQHVSSKGHAGLEWAGMIWYRTLLATGISLSKVNRE